MVIGGSTLGTIVVLSILLVVFVINRPEQVAENTETVADQSHVDQTRVEPLEPVDQTGSTEPADDPAKIEENPQPDPTAAEKDAGKDETPSPVVTATEPDTETKPDDAQSDPVTSAAPEKPDDQKPPLPTNPLSTDPAEPQTVERPDDLISRDVFGNPIEDDSDLGGLSAF